MVSTPALFPFFFFISLRYSTSLSGGTSNPKNATFVWVAAHKEVPSFRWLVRTIKEAEDQLEHMRAAGQVTTNKLRFLIYITSFSQGEADRFKRLTEAEKNDDETGMLHQGTTILCDGWQ